MQPAGERRETDRIDKERKEGGVGGVFCSNELFSSTYCKKT